jgi:hypothetical protein
MTEKQKRLDALLSHPILRKKAKRRLEGRVFKKRKRHEIDCYIIHYFKPYFSVNIQL